MATWKCRIVERDFTPSEAAKITGVSTALQRDWRRRGILPENPQGGWKRWQLADLIKLSVMKLFSDAGMDVSKTAAVAAMAIMPTHGALTEIDGAILMTGDAPDDVKRQLRYGSHPDETNIAQTFGRFLGVYGPDEHQVCRTADLASMEQVLDREHKATLAVIDCKNLASLIFERAGGPVIFYEVTAKADEAISA